jgi:predicted porin
MNKKILAVAVSAALMAGASAAMAGEAEFYGKVHVSVDSMDNGADSPNDDSGLFMSSNSSRLGVKGKEDLGNGMSAFFKAEMSTDYVDNGSISLNRNSYIGLKGGFGTVKFGRHDMPFKTAVRKFDLFGDTIGDNRALTRAKLGSDDWADRRNNLIMYSNKAGAVAFDIAYGLEDGTEDATDMGARVTFKQGPLTVMGAYEVHGSGNFGTNTDDSTGSIIAASYSMGAMTVAGGYFSLSTIDGGKNGSLGADVDATGYTLAGAYGVGGNTFKLQYTMAEPDFTGAKDVASTLLALGVDHKLSKMTSVYFVYASIANDDNASACFCSTGHASTVTASPVNGDDPSGFSVGMVHKF